MTNPFTGDYEAVIQIATRQVDGLLGALHQNGLQDTAPLALLHSTITRVGDPHVRPPDVTAFGDWVLAYQKAGPARGLDDVRNELTSAAAPGVAKLFTDAFVKFDKDWVIGLPPDVVRGTLKLQVGSVTISVPDGSSSEVNISAPVRAKYYPDPDTTEMPEPVHGEVRAAFTISVFTGPTQSEIIDHSATVAFAPGLGAGQPLRRSRLLIHPSSDDTKIQFVAAPGSGLTPADEARIAAEVRKYLREDLDWLPVDLPVGFPFRDFKGLGSGANPAIALPLQLSGAAPPPNGAQNITQSFIGSNGFGFAISAEYVNSIFPADAIRQGIATTPVTLTLDLVFVHPTFTYHLQVTSGPTLTFTTGAIEIAIGIHAHTSHRALPDFDIGVKQKVSFVLNADQSITLGRQGDPDVTTPWYVPSSAIADSVRNAIDDQLNQLNQDTSQGSINGNFADAKNKLVNGLQTFDAGASVTYTGVGVTTSGVTVTGDIGSSMARHAPVVTIEETQQGTAFTALDSWIPAGQISQFVWTWVEYPTLIQSPWAGVQKSVVDEHSFILPKPAGITDVSQICLRIEGSQIEPSGLGIAVIGGTTCQVPQPPTSVELPSWWGPMTIPFWRPDTPDTDPLKQAIAGHISVQASSPGDSQLQQNTLVYFVDTRRDHPLGSLCDALRQTQNSSTVDTIIVLPDGTFDQTRREVENRLGLPFEGIPPLQFTEDSGGGWTRTFGVSKLPSMYLIDARREFVWSHVGEPDPATLAAVLDKYDAPSAEAAFRPLQLAVSPGDVAPNVTFTDGSNHYALQRLRGRDILLNFWQSWSAPCLTELQRLQDLTRAGPKAPFIVAFHGGADSQAVDDVRKSLALSFPVVQDPQQQIARRHGVRCWPTTVTIDPNGSVEHIQFGTAHDHEGLDSAVK